MVRNAKHIMVKWIADDNGNRGIPTPADQDTIMNE